MTQDDYIIPDDPHDGEYYLPQDRNKSKFVPGPKTAYSTEQKAWLRAAHRTMMRLLKKQRTFHAPEFWEAHTGGDYPFTYQDTRGNRAISDVYKQLLANGVMTDSNPGWGKKVGNTSTFKPVYRSNIFAEKVAR